MSLVACILAGGNSRRMGQDKAALCIDGQTLLERTCRAAEGAGLEVLVVGGSEERATSNRRNWIPDEDPGRGPLAALAGALRHLGPGTDIVLCACDYPLVSATQFQWLVAHAGEVFQDESVIGLIPERDGEPQPLFAAYRYACLQPADVLLQAGSFAMRSLVSMPGFHRIPIPPDHWRALTDVDTPADLTTLGIVPSTPS